MSDAAVYTKSDLSRALALKDKMLTLEKLVKDSQKELMETYDQFVVLCPHTYAAATDIGNRQGIWYICKDCGVEDRASVGGSSGDEYDYGYPGHVNKDFWKDSLVEHVEKSAWMKYRRPHRYTVQSDGSMHRP